jgi:hypothetical protein
MTDDPADIVLHDPGPERPEEPYEFTERRRWPVVPIAVGVVLVLALAGGYMYLRSPSRQPSQTANPSTARPAQSTRAAEPGEQIPLPPLDQTDPLVRELVTRLSSHPAVAAWLTTDGLILNFAVVTQRIADGESPTKELGALGPVPAFRPQTSREDLFVNPSSYRRYDRYAEAIAALDARGAARLYSTLEPRIVEAYRRMGRPTGEFDPVLERAIAEMLKVPVVHGEVELVPKGIVYAFADPRLEGLSAAQKHLLRMGPENVQRIQAKLREIADYLAIPAARLPRATVIP